MVRPGPDETRWDDHKAATVMGYVADVKMGGIETVNYHARSAHGSRQRLVKTWTWKNERSRLSTAPIS
jgi:hypothetical protein